MQAMMQQIILRSPTRWLQQHFEFVTNAVFWLVVIATTAMLLASFELSIAPDIGTLLDPAAMTG